MFCVRWWSSASSRVAFTDVVQTTESCVKQRRQFSVMSEWGPVCNRTLGLRARTPQKRPREIALFACEERLALCLIGTFALSFAGTFKTRWWLAVDAHFVTFPSLCLQDMVPQEAAADGSEEQVLVCITVATWQQMSRRVLGKISFSHSNELQSSCSFCLRHFVSERKLSPLPHP